MKKESFKIYYLIILIMLIITTIIFGIGSQYNSKKIAGTLAMVVSSPDTGGGGGSSSGRSTTDCSSIRYLVSVNEKNYFYTPGSCRINPNDTDDGLIGKVRVTTGNFAFYACAYTKAGNKTINCGDNQRVEMVGGLDSTTNTNVYVYVCTEDAAVYGTEDKGDYSVCSQSYQGTVGPTLRYKYSMIAPYQYYDASSCGDASNYSLLPVIDYSSDKKISACVKTDTGMNTPTVSCSGGSSTQVNVFDTLNESNVTAYICRSGATTTTNNESEAEAELEDSGPRLDYNNVCADGNVKSTILLIGKLFNIAIYVVPLIIIVLGIVDYVKASISSDEQALNKATSSLIKRIVAGVAAMSIYTILPFLLSALHLTDTKYLENGEEYDTCINCLLYPFNGCKKPASKSNKTNTNTNKGTTNSNDTNTSNETFNFIASSNVSGGSFSEPDKCVGEVRRDTVNITYNGSQKVTVTGCVYKRDYSVDEIDVTCNYGLPTILLVNKLNNNKVVESDEAFIYVCHSDLAGQGGGGHASEGSFAGRK